MTASEYLDMAKTIVECQRQLIEAERLYHDPGFHAKFVILMDQFMECIRVIKP